MRFILITTLPRTETSINSMTTHTHADKSCELAPSPHSGRQRLSGHAHGQITRLISMDRSPVSWSMARAIGVPTCSPATLSMRGSGGLIWAGRKTAWQECGVAGIERSIRESPFRDVWSRGCRGKRRVRRAGDSRQLRWFKALFIDIVNE